MLFDISKADIEELPDDLFLKKQVSVFVLRLDKIHPQLSGNKLFKLHYFLKEAVEKGNKPVLTFGGAYSNHLAATAFACQELQLKSIGIVRGEKTARLSATLRQCLSDGMFLKYISRKDYDNKNDPDFLINLQAEFGPCIIVPEGGYHPVGAKGAALIFDMIKNKSFTHICMAVGTATTLAGILLAAEKTQSVMGIQVLKGITDNKERIKQLTGKDEIFKNLHLLDGYHFGGYAKKTGDLISFMNECWLNYNLPLDFVYTAKMLYGVIEAIKKDTFKKGSKIICLHTGGLQGNKSLPLNSLIF